MLNRKFAIIYAGFVVLSLVANYPGRPNADTVVMLWQAHNVGELNSWNSPFCTFFYGLLGPIFGYPLGALIAQSLVLLAWPAKVLGALISIPGARSVTRVTCIVLWTLVCCCFIALAGELVKDMIFCSFLSLVFLVSGSAESDELLWRIEQRSRRGSGGVDRRYRSYPAKQCRLGRRGRLGSGRLEQAIKTACLGSLSSSCADAMPIAGRIGQPKLAIWCDPCEFVFGDCRA